jgi:hypothetical protein
MATDENVLIEAARKERKNHQSGRNLLLTLLVAVVFAVIGWALVFRVRAFLKAIPFLPLGAVTGWLLVIGVVAFVVAGLVAVGGLLAANPRKRWGDPLVGACPACGNWTLRQATVAPAGGPKGVVILCYTKGCNHAKATVTTASRATS